MKMASCSLDGVTVIVNRKTPTTAMKVSMCQVIIAFLPGILYFVQHC